MAHNPKRDKAMDDLIGTLNRMRAGNEKCTNDMVKKLEKGVKLTRKLNL